MEQSKNAYYKSRVVAMSSFFWMCCKERQKKGRLALNNQEHFLVEGRGRRRLVFPAIFILVVRPQIECGLKCPEFLAMECFNPSDIADFFLIALNSFDFCPSVSVTPYSI